MSGKSTMLRTMGLAAVMALAGAPVCAHRLRVGGVAVHTSIKVSDSLEQGVSHFLAELRKLKIVVEAASSGRPVLFLLDEILHGTNSRERQIGARWVFRELLEHGALGAVSTHDMGLVGLPEALAERMHLVHFRENVHEGRMTFDYRLREGPVTSGNALQLMRLLGLDVPLAE
jgi:DNA mismatch repair ATPase MutS